MTTRREVSNLVSFATLATFCAAIYMTGVFVDEARTMRNAPTDTNVEQFATRYGDELTRLINSLN
jgi:hypothetical protein